MEHERLGNSFLYLGRPQHMHSCIASHEASKESRDVCSSGFGAFYQLLPASTKGLYG